jgi:sugar phosphate isomerase/epimerase
MRCHEVMALTVSNNEQATLAAAERMAAKAALIGAPWVVTVFTATMDQAAIARVKRCAAIFQEAGTRMAVEFSPLGTVGTIREGLEIVGAVGSDQSGLLIDSWHFFRGESTWADLDEVPLDRIAYIQFSDALACISDDAMDETMNRRAMPGMGTLDLDRFATILLERQWEGVVSVEVLSRDSADFPTVEFAQTAYDLTARYWI